ncbi:MAG TPA: cytochrome C [Thermomicrobiales bacterium]|nr:cytochrome C [Thermomicrobiales bacterium]
MNTALHSTASTGAAPTSRANSSARARVSFAIWPRLVLIVSAILLAISNVFEFWHLTLNAPQYPGGLKVTLFTHKMEGDVFEVDGLNHYIGMMPLGDAATFERSIAMVAMAAFVVMGILAAVLGAKKSAWLALPIVIFPIAFVADLFFWLYKAGHELDPTAALSSSVKPFTPAILGRGVVGQFSTDAIFGLGFWIAAVAAVLALVGIIGRLRALKATS